MVFPVNLKKIKLLLPAQHCAYCFTGSFLFAFPDTPPTKVSHAPAQRKHQEGDQGIGSGVEQVESHFLLITNFGPWGIYLAFVRPQDSGHLLSLDLVFLSVKWQVCVWLWRWAHSKRIMGGGRRDLLNPYNTMACTYWTLSQCVSNT